MKHWRPAAGAYTAWVKGEPNNRLSPEFCGVSDLTRMARGAGGWADENCANRNIYMCRVSGGSAVVCLRFADSCRR